MNSGIPKKKPKPSKYLDMIKSMKVVQEGKRLPRAVVLDRQSQLISLYRAATSIGAKIIVRNIGVKRDQWKCWRLK